MNHDYHQMLRAQVLDDAVRFHTRDVIQGAALTIQRLKPRNGEKSKLKDSQLRNVVNVAINAHNVQEIAAFIMYLMGRKETGPHWRYGEFGNEVVTDLTSGVVRKAATDARHRAVNSMCQAMSVQSLPVEQEGELLRLSHIMLARQYLGYLARLFVYVGREQDGQRWHDLAKLLERTDER